jgi:minor curlin subunit
MEDYTMKHIFIVLFTLIMMSSFAIAQSNIADIETLGNENSAGITQTGSNNNGVIDQWANNSAAMQTQTGHNNEARIDQLGDWPAGPVVNQTATQIQTGNYNNALILQKTDSGSGGSTAVQTQSGIDQYARAWQFSQNSTIVQDQTGDSRNWAEAYQAGSNNYIRQIQDGEGNRARVDEQTGGWISGNTAIQEQTGNWNNALIEQYDINGAKSWPGATGNIAEIYQNGYDNWAGDGYGAATEYGIRQWGDNNTAVVEQYDAANKSQVLQVGNDNTVKVDQSGGVGLFGAFGTYWNISQYQSNR